jgi:hypothetical protein
MTENYEVEITETARTSPKADSQNFNTICKRFITLEGLKSYLEERYGKMPKGRRKIYVDKSDGSTAQVGFLHSFWDRDISHNSESWFQTDWICINKLIIEPVLI